MNEKIGDLAVDEDVWASFEFWDYLDIEYLILDIDPDKLAVHDTLDLTELQKEKRRKLRRILDRLRQRSGNRQSIRPLDAIAHLQRVGHNFPERLVDAVQTAARAKETESENKRSAWKPNQESALQKEVKTLRKVLLGVAVERFRYSPEDRSSGVSNMADCLIERGISVHTDTLRKHLQIAHQELTQEEKRTLMR